ncbi:MAG: YcaO-like family protein [Pseudomonadota bacterium]
MMSVQDLFEDFQILEIPTPGMPIHLTVALPSSSLLARCPDFPAAARPEAGRVGQGRGLTQEASNFSAIGEAVETASVSVWGDEDLLPRPPPGAVWLTADALNGFSTEQIVTRATWNDTAAHVDWRPVDQVATAWFPVMHGLRNERAYAPADFVFIGRREIGDENAAAIGDSNGCAAGLSRSAARMSGLLELIERDAVARWWYGIRRCPPVPWRACGLPPELFRWLETRSRRTWIIDVTSDIGIPVAVAVGADSDGRSIALGHAAGTDWPAAALAATTELVQMEFSLQLARSMPSCAPAWSDWLDQVTLSTPPLDAIGFSEAAPETRAPLGLMDMLRACESVGVDVWFADLDRRCFGVAVSRAIAPALCHKKPRFGKHRLLAAEPGDGDDRRPLNPQIMWI